MALASLLAAAPLKAHHSISLFDLSAPIWVKGKVVSYQVRNPHVMLQLEVSTAEGKPQQLSVEGPNLMRHTRMGADEKFLKPGDVIEVCGFPFRADILADGEKRAILPALHGHLVKLPDGRMRLWGPYGKLLNCVRPTDTAQQWADFLNADPLGQEAWCRSLTYTNVVSLPSKEVIARINGLLKTPCL